MKFLGLGAAGGLMGIFGSVPKAFSAESEFSERNIPSRSYKNGLPPIKIKSVRAFATAPDRTNFIIVKVETNEPGLFGLGCATFTQRAHLVVEAVNKYLNEYCIGRDADNIEDIWNAMYVSSYWRNGPVLNNALSGLDQALWDIKGKRANMPVYQLLGGKNRFALETYAHVSASSPEAIAAHTANAMSRGYRAVRFSISNNKNPAETLAAPYRVGGFGNERDAYYDIPKYLKDAPKMFEAIRTHCGEDVGIIHDIHERVQPMDAINLCKSLEEYRPLFIEDPFSPEHMEWFKLLRQTTSCPIAMGELFTNQNEWKIPMVERYFDYIRIHISQIGGITPAMKVARLGEWFGVSTAWHGPGDCSPVGHAANAHVGLAIRNFGIQETGDFSDKLKEIFPGHTYVKDGYMYVNEAPGLGVDFNEELAAKYPISDKTNPYGQMRQADGTIMRP